jgi:hypothetical protein
MLRGNPRHNTTETYIVVSHATKLINFHICGTPIYLLTSRKSISNRTDLLELTGGLATSHPLHDTYDPRYDLARHHMPYEVDFEYRLHF